MEELVLKIIANQLGIAEASLSNETNLLTDLKIDSFDIVMLVTEFEDTFDIEIEEKEIKQIRTIDDIINLIKNKKGA